MTKKSKGCCALVQQPVLGERNMKKILLCIAAAALIALCGCDGRGGASSDTSDNGIELPFVPAD